MDDTFSIVPERLGDHSSLVRQECIIAGQIGDLLVRARQFSALQASREYQAAYRISENLEAYFAGMSDALLEAGDLFREASTKVETCLQEADEKIRLLFD